MFISKPILYLANGQCFGLILVIFQVISHEPHSETGDVHHRSAASVQPADGSFSGSAEAVPALSGPYGLYRRGGEDGHQGVSVPIQAKAMELQHGG